MKNCPACHYEYNGSKCPECGWPDTAKKHGLDDLISWAEDGGRFIWLDESISELAQLRADLQAAQERSAEQARQLEAARLVLHDVEEPELSTLAGALREMKNIIDPEETHWIKWIDKQASAIDAWLAANAQPQEQTA